MLFLEFSQNSEQSTFFTEHLRTTASKLFNFICSVESLHVVFLVTFIRFLILWIIAFFWANYVVMEYVD